MRKIAILFSLVFCMLACQRGEDSCSSDPQANLDALWTLIDEHYCFLDYKATEIGLDWNQVHSKYSCKLNPEMSRSQLFEVLCEMLGELQDGHVNLLTSIDLGRYWNWKDDYPANFDQELRESYLGKEYKISAGVKYRILEDNIGYLVYESFSDGIGEGNLDDILYYMRTCNGLIVDVRGNGGVHEFKGDIFEFLDWRKLEDLKALGQAKVSAVAQPSAGRDESNTGKASYLQSKERERELRKLRNAVAQCEKEIEILEQQVADKESVLSTGELQGADFYTEYQTLKNQLERCMGNWEEAEMRLEAFEADHK